MDLQPSGSAQPPGPPSRRGARRRDRHGHGRRFDLVPPHLPGHRTRRERFDEMVADLAAATAERFPRRLAHLRVHVEEVPAADPSPWEDAPVLLGRALPATRERPATVIVYRRPIETRCADEAAVEAMVRQVLAEQIGSLLGIPPEDIDPEAWDLED